MAKGSTKRSVKKIESNNVKFPYIFYDPNFENTPTQELNKITKQIGIGNNLTFLTDDNFLEEYKKKLDYNRKFSTKGVIISGQVDYVQGKLKEVRNKFIEFILSYTESDESQVNKSYELSNCRILILEYLYHTNLEHPELYQGTGMTTLKFNNEEVIEVLIPQITNLRDFASDINEHHNIRHATLNLILEFLQIQIEKLNLEQMTKPFHKLNNNYQKEFNLLQVWIALFEEGYLAGINQKELLIRRKDFFKLFDLTDTNYNDKHKNLKKANRDRVLFLSKLQGTLDSYTSNKEKAKKI